MKRMILIAILAVCMIAGGLLLYEEWEARRLPIILYETDTEPVYSITHLPETPALEPDMTEDLKEEEPTPKSVEENKTHALVSSNFGTVTIKGKTFAVKRGVSEKTLAGNIGWMESSAMPGGDGMCILMGHRNQQFRILKDVQAGDSITFTYADGGAITYIVQYAKLVDSDKALRFEAAEGKIMMLVTCYPFYYKGNAPQKFIMTAKME